MVKGYAKMKVSIFSKIVSTLFHNWSSFYGVLFVLLSILLTISRLHIVKLFIFVNMWLNTISSFFNICFSWSTWSNNPSWLTKMLSFKILSLAYLKTSRKGFNRAYPLQLIIQWFSGNKLLKKTGFFVKYIYIVVSLAPMQLECVC